MLGGEGWGCLLPAGDPMQFRKRLEFAADPRAAPGAVTMEESQLRATDYAKGSQPLTSQ